MQFDILLDLQIAKAIKNQWTKKDIEEVVELYKKDKDINGLYLFSCLLNILTFDENGNIIGHVSKR